MIYTRPGVRVMSIVDHRAEAWSISRPKTDIVNISEFEDVDFSLQDLCNITVEFSGSAGFRELLTNFRPYGVWAQSSRNIGIPNIPGNHYLSGVLDNEQYKMFLNVERDLETVHQDIARQGLPLSHMSNFVYSAPLRSFIALWRTLDDICPVYRYLYLDPIIEQYSLLPLDSSRQVCATRYQDFDIDPSYHIPLIYNSPAIGIIQERFSGKHSNAGLFSRADTMTSIDDNWVPNEITKLGNTKIFNTTISYALRAQLVRQSRVIVKDNNWQRLKELGWMMYELQPLTSTLSCTVIHDDASYDAVVKKRSCFIAQSDLWSDFILPGAKQLGVPGCLPCKGQKVLCTYRLEAIDCGAGNAATLPCPIWEGDIKYFDKRLEYAPDSPFYKMIEGWMRANFK